MRSANFSQLPLHPGDFRESGGEVANNCQWLWKPLVVPTFPEICILFLGFLG
jgi:hypothetical protein